tara:strand:- start:25581 stop:26015 length:435 start_codon:yes stop_codon:yes gene_type:complete
MYKINVIAHQLKGQKVADFGTIVSEKELNGNVKDLLEKGFIVAASKEEIEGFKQANKQDDAPAGPKAIDDMKKDELEAKAKELGLDISNAKNNPERKDAIKAEIEAREKRADAIKRAVDLGIQVADDMSNDDIEAAILKASEDK